MTPETRDLIDRLTNAVIQNVVDERELRTVLLNADDTLRSEIAYYIEDGVTAYSHNLGVKITTSIHKIEQYIADQIKVADWHVRHDALYEEWADLCDRDIAAMLLDEALDDLDNADTSGHA